LSLDPKSKAHWPVEKQRAYDRLQADLTKRLDELDATKGDAELVLTVRVHRGGFHAGRFDADTEYS
jgi:hypothetical protein